MEQELVKALINAGVGSVIAALILVGLYRIVSGLGGKFIEAQQGQAEALGAQAATMKSLTCSIQDFITKDNTEHREMLVLLRFIAQQQKELDEVRIEHNIRKKQAHPHCAAGTTEDRVSRNARH
jgi:hypothetical protein